GGKGLVWFDPTGERAPRPEDFRTINDWLKAYRNYLGRTQAEFAGRLSQVEVQNAESGTRPFLLSLRHLRDGNAIPASMVKSAIKLFYHQPEWRDADPAEAELFWRYVDTAVGSPEEVAVRNEIYERYDWISQAVVGRLRWFAPGQERDDVIAQCKMRVLATIDNHSPLGSFVPHAWANATWAARVARSEALDPNLDRGTRELVTRVRGEIARRAHEARELGESIISDVEIAEALDISVDRVVLARQIIAGRDQLLDQPRADGRFRETSDETAQSPFLDIEIAVDIRAALENLPEPAKAWDLIALHFMQGLSLSDVAKGLGISRDEETQLLTQVISRLRNEFIALGDEGAVSAVVARRLPDVAPALATQLVDSVLDAFRADADEFATGQTPIDWNDVLDFVLLRGRLVKLLNHEFRAPDASLGEAPESDELRSVLSAVRRSQLENLEVQLFSRSPLRRPYELLKRNITASRAARELGTNWTPQRVEDIWRQCAYVLAHHLRIVAASTDDRGPDPQSA
ncbi:sigma-70 family RNA polymerase sigma factor, partial [Nocardia africana]